MHSDPEGGLTSPRTREQLPCWIFTADYHSVEYAAWRIAKRFSLLESDAAPFQRVVFAVLVAPGVYAAEAAPCRILCGFLRFDWKAN